MRPESAMRHSALCATGALTSGIVKANFAPWPGTLSTQMRPPKYSTIWREMAKPRPLPPGRSVRAEG